MAEWLWYKGSTKNGTCTAFFFFKWHSRERNINMNKVLVPEFLDHVNANIKRNGAQLFHWIPAFGRAVGIRLKSSVLRNARLIFPSQFYCTSGETDGLQLDDRRSACEMLFACLKFPHNESHG